jgi:phage baseplate assembly protein W
MPNYAPRLPLDYNQSNGPYTSLTDINDVIKQNLKMLILTNPGERIMLPNFGVGIKRTLFENKSSNYNSLIQSKIKSQVSTYLPFVNINKITVSDLVENNTNFFENAVQVSIYYTVPNANISDILNINIINTEEG